MIPLQLLALLLVFILNPHQSIQSSLLFNTNTQLHHHLTRSPQPLVQLSINHSSTNTTKYKLLSHINAYLSSQNVDIWTIHKHQPTNIIARFTTKSSLIRIVNTIHNQIGPCKVTVLYEDVYRDLVQPSQTPESPPPPTSPNSWFKAYHPFDDIVSWYTNLAHLYNTTRVVQLNTCLGKTHQGRNLFAMHISLLNSTILLSEKKQVYIQAGIHAREWISHATIQYITYQLLTSEDPKIVNLLNRVEFIIVPVVNPDGYVYTWETDRLWRKNRRDNGNGLFGVDLNRNFDANWGHGGSSRYPYSDTYMGPNAASEPEVQALQAYFKNHTRIVAGLDLHAFSQLILRPIGWMHKDCKHEKQHRTLSKTLARIIKRVHGKSYTSEKSIDLYATTGAASDFFYLQKFNTSAGIARPYGLTIELRPAPVFWGPGFVLPKEQIVPTGEEIFPAVIRYAETALKTPLFE